MSCEKHKKEVAGISDMKVLAEMIGDLHYESLTNFIFHFREKIHADGLKDAKNGRDRLGLALLEASYEIMPVCNRIKEAWEISKPFMK